MKISELKKGLDEGGIDYSHCLEKRELVDLYTEMLKSQGGGGESGGEGEGEGKESDKEKEKEKENEGDEEFECPICYCEYPHTDVRTLQCGHSYCNECICRYLVGLIECGQVSIFCPEPRFFFFFFFFFFFCYYLGIFVLHFLISPLYFSNNPLFPL